MVLKILDFIILNIYFLKIIYCIVFYGKYRKLFILMFTCVGGGISLVFFSDFRFLNFEVEMLGGRDIYLV